MLRCITCNIGILVLLTQIKFVLVNRLFPALVFTFMLNLKLAQHIDNVLQRPEDPAQLDTLKNPEKQ